MQVRNKMRRMILLTITVFGKNQQAVFLNQTMYVHITKYLTSVELYHLLQQTGYLRTAVTAFETAFDITVFNQRMKIKRGMLVMTAIQQVIACQYLFQLFVLCQGIQFLLQSEGTNGPFLFGTSYAHTIHGEMFAHMSHLP